MERSLELLREEKFLCAITEHWNSHACQYQDLLGFADILAIGNGQLVLVQTTTGDHDADRIRKIITQCFDAAKAWLRNGGEIEVHGWRTLKGQGWQCKRRRLQLSDFTPESRYAAG